MEAWQVLQAIPEFDQRRSLAQLQERLPAGALVLIAEADGQPVGFKLGYAAEDGSLYSWLGGYQAFELKRLAKLLAGLLLAKGVTTPYTEAFRTFAIGHKRSFKTALAEKRPKQDIVAS